MTLTRIYRQGVGVVIVNDVGQVLVAQRVDLPDVWQFPQGGIEAGEDIMTAARREVFEEIGIKDVKVVKIADDAIAYDFPVALQGTYIGQQHHWVLARYVGDDKQIRFDVTGKPEFQAFKWTNFKQATSEMTGFKHEAYQKVYRLFAQDIGEEK